MISINSGAKEAIIQRTKSTFNTFIEHTEPIHSPEPTKRADGLLVHYCLTKGQSS